MYRTTAVCEAAMDQKAQIDDLAARREVLEAQMAVRSQRLEAAGVGLHSNLVDAQVRCFLWRVTQLVKPVFKNG